MKTTSLIFALAIGLSSAAFAGEKTKDTKTKPAKTQKAKTSQVQANGDALTGSYIKRDVRRKGLVTDGPDPVYVIDQSAIQISGAADLREVLLRKGFAR